MPPPRISIKKVPDVTPTPLADFFWIAGVDSSDLLKAYTKLSERNGINGGTHGGVGYTIEEDQDAESSSLLDSRPVSRSSAGDWNRFSRLSNSSSRQLKTATSDGTASNRSSATIRPVQQEQSDPLNLLDDADFDAALRSFATDRDSFLSDLNRSAGAITNSPRQRQKPKTQRITSDDTTAPSALKSGIGSVRRHMSFRDMNSTKRQSSVARNGKLIQNLQSTGRANVNVQSLSAAQDA